MARRVAGVIAAIVVAAAVVLAFQLLRGRPATPLRPGQPVPDVELKAVEGGAPARLRANLGPGTLIVFLDTRWPRMTGYVELLERLNRRYHRRGFRVVAIALDEDAETLRQYIQRNAITFTMLHDPAGAASRAGYGRVIGPVAYLVDGKGNVVESYPEPVDWRREDQRKRVEALLPPPPPGWF